jgi:phage/plasmid-associated DNA primase
VTTATPDFDGSSSALLPGQINLDLIPADFPLTALRDKKAYLPNWPNSPLTLTEIKKELDSGRATGVGLICGQFSNELALIMVDVDGKDAIPEIEELGGGSIDEIFPPTLAISSGKEGRFRLLFRVPTSRIQEIPDKATLRIDDSPWEILWRSRQGAIMGSHPETPGYFTLAGQGFEHVKKLPEMPEWLYKAINKAYPNNKYRRRSSNEITGHVTQNITLAYEEGTTYHKEEIIAEALTYLQHIDLARADDYHQWVTIGMALHQIDNDLLEIWTEWSEESDAYQEGCCDVKWESFERLPGGHSPEGGRGLHTLRAIAKEDGYIEVSGITVPTQEEFERQLEEGVYDDVMMEGDSSYWNQVTKLVSLIDEGGGNNKSEKNGKHRNPPASVIADYLFDRYRSNHWRYDPRFETWLQYAKERGIWLRQPYREHFLHDVQFSLHTLQLPGGYTSKLVSDVANLLRHGLICDEWDEYPSRLAFSNGVLELDTGEFLEHSPENYITWGINFDYIPSAEPGPITDWLYRTQYNDDARVQVLRAWLRACLVGKGHELQRFLELIGPGGRGKSTFANLCCALVGLGNYASTTLNQLEQSRFEVASIKGKRLTLINDSERYGGSAQIFKALTGGDNLRYEEKMKNIGEPFVYTGMVMVVANEPIQTTDNTSGLGRRRLTVEFNRRLYDKNSDAKDMIKIDNGVISGVWRNYLPGLVNWVLQMSELDMRRYLLDTQELVPALKKVRNTILLNSNNLIEWLQSEVVADTDHVSAVGKKIPASKDTPERYCNSNSHLYPSYCAYCEDTGSKPVGQKRFIALLLDCCRNQLELPNVFAFSKNGRPFVKGLAVRNSDQKFKNYATILPEKEES